MTIKEKAIAYDKALEIARQYWNNRAMPIGTNFKLERMFPELKKSEEDKRIRKDIVTYLKSILSNKKYGDKFIESWIAWLEKQAEQKPVVIIPKFRVGDEIKTSNEESLTITKIDENGYWSEDLFICGFDEECIWDLVGQKHADKIEPKFKVGDWIIYKDDIWKICNISLGAYYELLKVDGEVIIRHFEGVDKTAHLWTVKDAKDGDVLVGGEQVFLFKRMDTSNSFYAHCNYHFIGYDSLSVYDCSYSIDNICPATKKQRDVLMKAIADAGYAFDFEKKELKKIEQKPQHIVSAEAMNDKNAWSEKDEKMLNGVILDLTFLKCEANSNEGKKAYQREIDLLKSLKDKQEWNEDDKRRFNGIIADVETMKEQAFNIGAKVAYQKEIDWLKDKVQPQPKQEWSEEDEYHKRQILRILKDNGCSQTLQERTEKWIEERLKSPRPQAQWKPTDKQMCNLSYAAHHHCAFFDTEILKGLYDDLKKL